MPHAGRRTECEQKIQQNFIAWILKEAILLK